MAKQEETVETFDVVMLDPSLLIADDNARYGLKQSRIELLASQILDAGGVNTPLEVEELENGQYKVTAGHYRKAAVDKLNAESNAGLLLPCIIHQNVDAQERLKRQLMENIGRQELTPMDMAVAIDKLFKANVPRQEIRNLFSRQGGRKGNVVAPASNSFINITHSFLELPKKIQQKIHEGLVGVAAAYELTKVSPDKREAVLQRAEMERVSQFEKEEKEEAKFLGQEQKVEEAKLKTDGLAKLLAEAQELAAKTKAELIEKTNAAAEMYKAAKTQEDAESKALAQKAYDEAKILAEQAEKDAAKATKTVEKISASVKTAEQTAAERAKKLADLRKKSPKPAAKKSPSPQDIKKAAAKEGDGNVVPLKAQDMRAAIDEMILPGSFPKVKAIGEALKACFSGIGTNRDLINAIAKVTGEHKEKAAAK